MAGKGHHGREKVQSQGQKGRIDFVQKRPFMSTLCLIACVKWKWNQQRMKSSKSRKHKLLLFLRSRDFLGKITGIVYPYPSWGEKVDRFLEGSNKNMRFVESWFIGWEKQKKKGIHYLI